LIELDQTDVVRHPLVARKLLKHTKSQNNSEWPDRPLSGHFLVSRGKRGAFVEKEKKRRKVSAYPLE
jgi:hypothetical protein